MKQNTSTFSTIVSTNTVYLVRNGKVIRAYLNDIRHFKRLTPEALATKFAELAAAPAKGAERDDIISDIFCGTLRLVLSLVPKFSHNDEGTQSELIQEGSIGLLEAIQNFDPQKGAAFSTYAYKCIQNSMNTWFRKNINTNIEDHIKAVGNGDDDTIDIIEQRIDEDAPSYLDEETRRSIEQALNANIHLLSEKQRNIICLHYGINGALRQYSLEEIGHEYNNSGVAIGKMLQRAFAKLRQSPPAPPAPPGP